MNTSDSPVAETQYGRVRGVRLDGLEEFIEIPYGADTSGANRFKAPRPPAPWTGNRETSRWTTRTAQYPDAGLVRTPKQWYSMQGSNYAPGIGEDSLTLNVWTPSTVDGGSRPVLVWIHGGGYSVGHAISEMSDGANFAREHDAVFVSVTHRLNAFGFLHLQGLGGDEYRGSGNAGLLDIIAALEWIQNDIRQFGGDPGSVTVVGESGGGGKVSTLMVMDAARGLFHRAVCESGVALRGVDAKDSEAYALRLIEQLGGTDVTALTTATMQELVEAQLVVDSQPGAVRLGPTIDGDYLVDAPLKIWRAGGGSAAPLLTGTMHDEVSVFGNSDLDIDLEMPEGHPGSEVGGGTPAFDASAGVPAVEALAGGNVDAAVEARRALYPGENDVEVAQSLIGDILFRWPAATIAAERAAHGKSTWVYQLDWASPRIAPRGAPHSSSVSLFFANDELVAFTRGLPEAHVLSIAMSSALASFMRNGNPSSHLLPDWPAYDGQSRDVMVFDSPSHVVADPDGPIRVAFALIDPPTLL
jgi:para-nitrobenzyl esterase